MVDIIHTIQECPCQFVALLLKHLYMLRGIKLLLVVIVGANKDRRLKCNEDTLMIIQRFIYDHLPNGPSIPPQSVFFQFGWMNYNPFNAISWANRKVIASVLNHIVYAAIVSPFCVFAANAQCFRMAGSFPMKYF